MDTMSNDCRAAMRPLAATVTIITLCDADGASGMTATAVTSVSVGPPALLVSVNRGASLHHRLRHRPSFCVNLLGRQHADISQVFGGAVAPAARFDHADDRLAALEAIS